MAKNISNMSPQEIVQLHEKNVRDSLQKLHLKQLLIVHFPERNRIPLFGRLGVWFVHKSGGIIVTKYGFDDDTITSNSRPKK